MTTPRIECQVIRAEKLVTKAGKPYYTLELQTGREAGSVKKQAKIWEDVLVTIREDLLPKVGQYWTGVRFKPNVYNGEEQMIILGYYVVQNVTPDEIAQFREAPAVDTGRVLDRMFSWSYWEPDIRGLMEGVFADLSRQGLFEKFRDIPAGASYHHSVRGGFLLHIDEMLDMADRLCGVLVVGDVLLSSEGVRGLEKDAIGISGVSHYEGIVDYQILRAAIVLHDIGKVHDYDAETLQFRGDSVSECLGHTVVGILLVDRHWPGTSPESLERKLRLQHAIAAHHGAEQGILAPRTSEAVLLHHIDMISASLDVFRTAYRDVQQNRVPNYSKMLSARPFVPQYLPPQDRVVYPLENSGETPDVPEIWSDTEEAHEEFPWK